MASTLCDLVERGSLDLVTAGTVLVVSIAVGFVADSLIARAEGSLRWRWITSGGFRAWRMHSGHI
ncbi:MAG: hypothetical protein IT173_06340 [Acidobacteria bacterium]|nr:hypothetical protein [Acidobacteriota bacterium]